MKTLIWIMLWSAGLSVLAGCGSDDPVAACEKPPLEIVTPSSAYLNHRFFQLDLPFAEFPGGRFQGDIILPESIKIFQLMPGGEPTGSDITNVAAYVDSLGYLTWDSIDFENPHLFGRIWREITAWDPMRDANGGLIAVDLRTQMDPVEALAVIYEIRQDDGTIVKIGDRPGRDLPQQTVAGVTGLYFRMKLLKAPWDDQEPHSFLYVLRNIYSLGAKNIDATNFHLRIEDLMPGNNQPQQDESGLDYIRIFGLDRDDPHRSGFPDGIVDMWDPYLFDLQKGLLKFPLDFPMPFAPGGNPTGRVAEADMLAEAHYSAYADTSIFVWENSYLRSEQSWQIYDPSVNPDQYPLFQNFRIISTYGQPGPD